MHENENITPPAPTPAPPAQNVGASTAVGVAGAMVAVPIIMVITFFGSIIAWFTTAAVIGVATAMVVGFAVLLSPLLLVGAAFSNGKMGPWVQKNKIAILAGIGGLLALSLTFDLLIRAAAVAA